MDKVCTLFILIDNSFLTLIHNGDLRGAVAQVLSSLEEVNAIFRSTDFDSDGFPDNIGFIIKYFVVLQTESSPMNLLPKYTTSAVDGIIEGNETCDCGTTWDCKILDPCCTPRDREDSCNVNKQVGIDCHPSQGICCTLNCRYKNLLNHNLVHT
ncbi:uncharacterized protein LOC111691981 [Anoplophora glabripennis]|uniref:uncharacterized protein LOC111691981 n=1 Tax=Anoplophora glabripennis TaxID=217634 RepID=UPI000C75F384|nr:uncharacterized protein LOC111691981 [Anoplophora glabripennis]